MVKTSRGRSGASFRFRPRPRRWQRVGSGARVGPSTPDGTLRACGSWRRAPSGPSGAGRGRGGRGAEWPVGGGPEVGVLLGALLLVLTGRGAAVITDLDGDGVPEL